MSNIFLGAAPFFSAFAHSDLFGKFIFLSLFALSILSWVILINKTIQTRNARRASSQFKDAFKGKKHQPLHIDHQDFVPERNVLNPFLELYKSLKSQAMEILQKNQLAEKKSKKPTYLSSSDIEMMGYNLSSEISEHSKNFDSNLFVLATIISLAPFLGLLGTVWGILITFSEMQARTVASAGDMVLGGISMALATTVLGLVVAIPALIAYNYLKNSNRNFESEMHGFSSKMLASVELRYRQVDINET